MKHPARCARRSRARGAELQSDGEAVDPRSTPSRSINRPAASVDRLGHNGGNDVKIQFMKTLLILGVLLAAGNVTSNAQALIEGSIETTIPFAFIVKDTTLPAGKYILRRVDPNDPGILEISNARNRTTVLFEAQNTQANRTPRDAELVFDKVGDQYFLAQVWTSGSEDGYQLPETKAQQRLESGGMKAEHHSIVGKLFKRTK